MDTIAFDKTGTLTRGKPQVTDIVAVDISEEKLLTMTSAIEVGSNHPLATALVAKAKEAGVTIPHAQDKRRRLAWAFRGW